MGVTSPESASCRTKNARVEVTSEEEGFTGAWFLAKIIDPYPRKKPNHVYVQYETLLDEKSSKPLKEFVSSSLVRPIPPKEPEKVEGFKLNDVVDAFYKDGWWTGMITNVFEENSRFEVTFTNPPDLIVFRAEDLRVHRDWVRGKWIRPKKKQRSTGMLFSKGKQVEVSLAEVENTEVWFPAIVLEDTGNGSFLVEYQCLGKNGEHDSVKVKVDSLHIRPSPPQLKGKNYDVQEKVDAYLELGWWTGVITKKLPDNKYNIFFKETNKERLVNQSDIRPHMEWKEGNWFNTSQDVPASLVSPDSVGALKGIPENRTSDSLNTLDIRVEWEPPSLKAPTTSENEKVKLVNAVSEESSKKMQHANNSDLRLLPTDHVNLSSVNPLDEGIHLTSTSINGGARTNNLKQSMVDLPSENFSQGKRARGKRQKVDKLEYHTPQRLRSAGRQKSRITEAQALAADKTVGELEHCTPEKLGGKSQVLPIAQISNAETPGDKNDDAVKCTEENLVQKDCVTEVSITHNSEKAVIEGSQAENLPVEVLLDVSGDQQLVQDPPVEKIKADQLERHIESTEKRKRGRPPKLHKSPIAGQQKAGKLAKRLKVTERNRSVTSGDMASAEVVLPVVVGLEATKVEGSMFNKEKTGGSKNIVNGLVDKKSKSSSKIEVCTAKKDKLRSKKGKQVLAGKQEKDSLKRGKALNIDAGSPNQDFEVPSAGKIAEVNGQDGLVKEAEASSVRLPFNMSDDEPLSMWLEPPKTADAISKLVASAGTSQGREVNQQCTTNCSQDIVIRSSQCNDHILPFVKSSPLWKSIESMQVFHLFPQNPHFRTLFSKKEGSREGLAIALMVDFVNVVEKICTLQPDGPKSIIEDTVETLHDLEDNGFDVNIVRDRVVQLLLIKNKREVLEAKAKEGSDQIEEEEENVKDLNNRILLLQEELALVLSTKGQKDSTVTHLKSTVDDANNNIRKLDLEFKALEAAPWQVG
ncbi:DUF724 domain-containing protein 6-like isoform X2 [Apium graveolens]|uniref:DUF724 domain-containing protein 6-like isoform X2 n=1 Tax=Apium graveolens TaxID=4045 RepID=UPI003D7B5748